MALLDGQIVGAVHVLLQFVEVGEHLGRPVHQEPQFVGVVAGDHVVAVLEQPVVAVVGVAGEHRVERQAGRNLLLQWAVGFAAMHHHLVLHHHAAVVDRRQDPLWAPSAARRASR